MEKAARLAANSESTQSASIRLLDELMEVTIGRTPRGSKRRNLQSRQWLRSKKATGQVLAEAGTNLFWKGFLPVALRETAEELRSKA